MGPTSRFAQMSPCPITIPPCGKHTPLISLLDLSPRKSARAELSNIGTLYQYAMHRLFGCSAVLLVWGNEFTTESVSRSPSIQCTACRQRVRVIRSRLLMQRIPSIRLYRGDSLERVAVWLLMSMVMSSSTLLTAHGDRQEENQSVDGFMGASRSDLRCRSV